MKKILVLCSATVAVMALALSVAAPAAARGAPVLDQATVESAVIIAVPVPAVVVQDAIAFMTVESAAAVVAQEDVFALPQKGGVEVGVTLCTKALPMEIIGIARACSVWEVAATGIEKVGGITRTSTAIFGDDDMRRAEEMIAAIETQRRFFVQRT